MENEPLDTRPLTEPSYNVYIVNKLHWQWTNEWYTIQDDTPVRAFLSRRDAERERDSLEELERDRINEEVPRDPGTSSRPPYTPHTESGMLEPLYEVVAVECLP